ncbi:MAG TPA: CHAT domain-containing tetratricopeptide repeat protein [Blastocatellia bacterium]|nr:CHAT domain-containing tetratricopeptide repeat protein [Blastocatellia bacterium]
MSGPGVIASRVFATTFLLFCLLAAAAGGNRLPQTAGAALVLEIGKPIERDLSPTDIHEYQLNLSAGQFARVVVSEQYLSVVIKVSGPDGQLLAEVETNSAAYAEHASIIAAQPGAYRLQVRKASGVRTINRYQIKLEELRTATPQDARRVEAEKLATAAYRLGQRADAESKRQAIAQLNEVMTAAQAIGDTGAQTDALFCIGDRYWALGEKEKARATFQQVVQLAHHAGDSFREATGQYNVGFVHHHAGKHGVALEYDRQAQALAHASGNRMIEAMSFINAGYALSQQGEIHEALNFYAQAMPLFQALGDQSGVLTALNNRGATYRSLGDPQQELAVFIQALENLPDRPEVRCDCLVNIGYAYYSLGELQSALEYFRQGATTCRTARKKIQEGLALTGIGATHARLDDPQQALAYYQQALPIEQAARDTRSEGITLGATGLVHEALGDPRQAIKYVNEALIRLRAVGDHNFQVAALAKLGALHEQVGELSAAKDFYDQALALSRKLGERRGEAEALLGLAHIASANHQLAEARADAEQALALIESVQTRIAGANLRAAYLASVQDGYDFYIDLLMQMHRQEPGAGTDAAALAANERARARGLIDLLAEARVDVREGVDPRLLERERTLHQLLNAASERQMQVLGGLHTAQQAEEIKQRIDALAVEYRQVQSRIRAASPRYAALTQIEPLGLKEIQQQVLDRDTLLLEYALGDKRSYLWAVTGDSLTSYELPARPLIEARVRRVLALLTARQPQAGESDAQYNQRVRDADANYPREAAALSQMLLGPVAAQLSDKRLAIVASGVLQYIPFAALPMTGDRPLILDHEVINLPSASVLALQRRNFAGRAPASKRLAVIADPVFERDDPRVARITKPRDGEPAAGDKPLARRGARTRQRSGDMEVSDSPAGFSRLVYSRVEANRILALVSDASQRLSALDFNASRALALSTELSQYRYVHFATHGVLDVVHPELSGIVLSQVDRQGQSVDGFLGLHDLYNLKLNADLVVLSACRTALGKLLRGEGLIGLARGFMYAGAPRIVASLWKVQDDATAELMAQFYANMLRGGKRPAAALRAAQVAMLEKRQWQSPFFWAAFVLQGEWR